MNRFDLLDQVPVPDQWDDILRRADWATPRRAEPSRQRRVFLVAAAAVLAGLVVASALLARDDGEPVVTAESPTTEAPDPGGDPSAEPAIVCPDGGLISTAIPPDAAETSTLSMAEMAHPEGHRVRSWEDGGLEYELLLPSLLYIDFVGERTEEVSEGMLFYKDGETRLLGPTGLSGPCDRFELTVTGADEQTRVEALRATARTFEFDPGLGVTDCGPLSPEAIQVVSGPTAMSAVADIEVIGYHLRPGTLSGSFPTVTRRDDGRCEVAPVNGAGGFAPGVVISGQDGRYGLDVVRGFDGAEGGTVPVDVTASVNIQGTAFEVFVDYWCDDCARAEVTIHYPDEGMTATAEAAEAGPITGTVERAATPGGHGWVAVVWTAANGDGRGIWTTTIPSGDFAAG